MPLMQDKEWWLEVDILTLWPSRGLFQPRPLFPRNGEQERKREREEKKEKKEEAWNQPQNLIFVSSSSLKVRFFISWAPFCYQNNFSAWYYKSRYVFWDFEIYGFGFMEEQNCWRWTRIFRPRVSSHNDFCMPILRVSLTFLDKSFFMKLFLYESRTYPENFSFIRMVERDLWLAY